MATVGDTIGKAIADVIATFSDVTLARAEYGLKWSDVAGGREGGRVIVAPMGAVPVDGQSYTDSALVEFTYGVRFEVPCRTNGADETAQALLSECRKKFNPDSRTLQVAVAALSSDPQPIRVTMIPTMLEAELPVLGSVQGTIIQDVSIRAQTWVSV